MLSSLKCALLNKFFLEQIKKLQKERRWRKCVLAPMYGKGNRVFW